MVIGPIIHSHYKTSSPSYTCQFILIKRILIAFWHSSVKLRSRVKWLVFLHSVEKYNPPDAMCLLLSQLHKLFLILFMFWFLGFQQTKNYVDNWDFYHSFFLKVIFHVVTWKGIQILSHNGSMKLNVKFPKNLKSITRLFAFFQFFLYHCSLIY